MPSVRKIQAAVVQGRDQRAQAASSRPDEQRRDGEGEGHREADIAHVEHRRVEDQARVLQQRVQVAAVLGGGQQALERVGGEQHEQQQADGDQAQHAEHARHHGLVQRARQLRDRHASSPTSISTHSSSEPSWPPQTAASR